VVLLDLEEKELFLVFRSRERGFKVIDKNLLRSFKYEHIKQISVTVKAN